MIMRSMEDNVKTIAEDTLMLPRAPDIQARAIDAGKEKVTTAVDKAFDSFKPSSSQSIDNIMERLTVGLPC